MRSALLGSKVISVLGMHRSGTSAIMRSFNLLGVYIGEQKDLVPPYPENPEGFWERLDVIDLQERLLAVLKRSWSTGVPLSDRWQDAPEVQPFKKELVALLEKTFSGRSLWGWKEPRSLILFDLWKDILESAGVELFVVFVVRNPRDVAKSLAKRNGFPCDKGYGIWFNYNISALRAITDIPTVFISYDNFLADWEQEMKRCAQALDLGWPEDDKVLNASIQSFLRPDLRHSCSSMVDLKEAEAPEPVIELYKILEDLVSGDADFPSKRNDICALYSCFFSHSRFYQYDATKAWDIEQQLVEANSRKENNLLSEEIALPGRCTKFLSKIKGFVKKKSDSTSSASDFMSRNSDNQESHFYNLISGHLHKHPEFVRVLPVDIVIPVYNALEATKACIESVLTHSDNCRLIIVNDASTEPGIVKYLESLRAVQNNNIEVIIHHNDVNIGFLKTINDTYKKTKWDFVILNSDTEVPPRWLDRLFAPLHSFPTSVASATPFSNASMGWLGCNFPDAEQDSDIFKSVRVSVLDSFFAKYSPDTPIEIFSGCGFCMAFNRTVVERIGLFDEVFGRGYCEEVDWSLRSYNAGYKNVLVTNLFVFHKHGASFDTHEKQNLQDVNLQKLLMRHGKKMERLGVFNSKNATDPIRDGIAVIADACTKGADRWVAVVGGEKSSLPFLKERMKNIRLQYGAVAGIVFESDSCNKLTKMHVLSPAQERVLSLPHDDYEVLAQVLLLLHIDIVAVVENDVLPVNSSVIRTIKQLNMSNTKIIYI